MLRSKEKFPWLYDILLLVVLAAAAWLRFTGSDWGELQHQHPDELTVTSTTYDIAPIGTSSDLLGPAPTVENQPWRAAYPETFTDCLEWGGYFDTACSPLNPQNRGHNAYVYGSLPIFIVRYVAQWSGQMGDLKLFGRQMSAVADLVTIFLLYLVAARLYNRRVALLAAIFSSLAVMQIQQSHFYTTDNFAVTFMILAAYFAVEIIAGGKTSYDPEEDIANDGLVLDGHLKASSCPAAGDQKARIYFQHPLRTGVWHVRGVKIECLPAGPAPAAGLPGPLLEARPTPGSRAKAADSCCPVCRWIHSHPCLPHFSTLCLRWAGDQPIMAGQDPRTTPAGHPQQRYPLEPAMGAPHALLFV